MLGSGTAAAGCHRPEQNSARPTPARRAVVICMGNVLIPDISHALVPSWTCQEAKVQHGPDLLYPFSVEQPSIAEENEPQRTQRGEAATDLVLRSVASCRL